MVVLFSKSVYFDGFIFEVSVYFEVFEAVLHELFKRDNITKLSTVEQHCNYPCSVMLTVIFEIRIFVTARNSQSILAFRASKINFNKTACLLMALAIDSVVPGCRIYKDFGVLKWIPSNHVLQGLQSRRLVCFTHAHSDSLKSSHDAVNFCCGN